MDESPVPRRSAALRIILIAAVIQGWGLYGLSWAVDHNAWPSHNSGLLMALYALITVAPLTLQFLVEHHSRRLTWILAAAIGLCFAGFGWHFGHNISNQPGKGFFDHEASGSQTIAGVVLWLLSIPFLQTRLVTGRWWPQYTVFFAQAWRNVLTLGEAALFTGLFWGLLRLCDALFEMLGITFFRELYQLEIFSIPVTWLTFGVSLHLIAGLDHLTTLALRQILNVLKWLALPAVLIVAFFTVALVLSLPGLVGTGKRTIDASTLLWVTAVVVLLFNAAYRDGETEQPYPRAIGLALRALVPLVLAIALTATWNLYVRTRVYGITVDRAWGWLVAVTAIAFSAGYSMCAFRGDRWLRGMSNVNVIVILVIIGAVSLAMTPILSPYRLAANSQYRVALGGQTPGRKTYAEWRSNLLRTLRFDAGEYGKAKLRMLAASSGVPPDLRETAGAALADNYPRWDGVRSSMPGSIERLHVFPKDHPLPGNLKGEVEGASKQRWTMGYLSKDSETFGIFVDLTGDGTEDFAVVTGMHGMLFEHDEHGWRLTANLVAIDGCPLTSIVSEMEAGHFGSRPPHLADLTIGTRTYAVQPEKTCN